MRTLPTRRNPHITVEETPIYDELLNLRKLGRTKLTVQPGQVGTSNATKPENLGHVEYAHLRAPLPDDLEESEIFGEQPKDKELPSTYFLMRRSKDGFVSATGMFKVAFPWAAKSEEKTEREYLYTLETTAEDDVAGNVWVEPEYSLELAAEYGMTAWIRALLDPTDIAQTARKPIMEPPKFDLPIDPTVQFAPPVETKSRRARSTRSSSPVKTLQPATSAASKAKSPRKRQTKAQKEANIASANAASASLQSALDDAVSIAEAEESDIQEAAAIIAEGEATAEIVESEEVSSAAEEEPAVGDKVKVEVEQAVEISEGKEITHTNVTVSMPAGLPELPIPEDTEAMLEKARQMVEEAKALEESSAKQPLVRKRKMDEVDPSDIDKELPVQPAKKAKVLEEKLKRERVRTRALVGVGAMLGIAAAIPYFF